MLKCRVCKFCEKPPLRITSLRRTRSRHKYQQDKGDQTQETAKGRVAERKKKACWLLHLQFMKAKPQYEMACMAAKFKKVQAQKVSNLTYINCNVPHKSQKGHLVAEWLKAFLSIKVSHFCLLITLFYHFKCVFFKVFFNLLFTHMAYFCSIILIILIPFCEAQRAPSLQKCDTCSYLTSAHTQNCLIFFLCE